MNPKIINATERHSEADKEKSQIRNPKSEIVVALAGNPNAGKTTLLTL
jgi:tRNA U34 5-carboxymethylaminomethyl modifying GTPase MnmE/TrmE